MTDFVVPKCIDLLQILMNFFFYPKYNFQIHILACLLLCLHTWAKKATKTTNDDEAPTAATTATACSPRTLSVSKKKILFSSLTLIFFKKIFNYKFQTIFRTLTESSINETINESLTTFNGFWHWSILREGAGWKR